MKTIIYYRDSNGNPGDTFSNMGCQLLCGRAIGPHYTVSWYATQPFSTDMPLSTHDAAVVCGSPWLWDQCNQSEKYQLLRQFLDFSQAKLKLVIGLGSSFILGQKRPPTLDTDIWREFDLVLCRDQLAADLLSEDGVKATVVPCPAYFAGLELAKRTAQGGPEVLVYTAFADPRSVPGAKYADPTALAEFQEFQRRWLKQGRPVLTMTVPDLEEVNRLGKEPTWHSVDPATLTRHFTSFSAVYTGRVHGAIVAQAAGCAAHLFPIDSRAVTAVQVGVKLFGRGANDHHELQGLLDLRGVAGPTVVKMIRDALGVPKPTGPDRW